VRNLGPPAYRTALSESPKWAPPARCVGTRDWPSDSPNPFGYAVRCVLP